MSSIPWVIGAFVVGGWFGFLVCAIMCSKQRSDIYDD